jgi:DNA-binding winged helix-turn-helix (wHTH) protein/tetratricopeptide (TPR) repeat protein
VDPEQRLLLSDGEVVPLAPKAFDTLLALVESQGAVLLKDELLKKVWPDTFVEEGSLAQNISILRKVLGEGANGEAYIQTIPKRGYRFVFPVAAAPSTDGDYPERLPTARPARLWASKPALGAAALVAAALTLGIVAWHRPQLAPITDRDVLVLADFTNSTGDPVFDGTLREALSIGLEESPFLKIMDDGEVAQTLRLMGRSAKERITNDIAHEICIRTGQKATIGGSIASLGKTYAITLVASNCQTDATLARAQVEAQDKEHVLKAVGAAAVAVRAKLGEALRSIQANNASSGESWPVTTASLEAFQAYAQGQERRNQGAYQEAISFCQKATELDPNFATAYSTESVMYINLGQVSRSEELLKKAFSLVDHVSDRERLAISGVYYWRVTGELDKAIDIFLQIARTYPRSGTAHNSLGVIYEQMGDQEKELREYQEALRLSPWSSVPYANVMIAFAERGRFDEAKAVGEQAFARKLDAAPIHLQLLAIAYEQGDAAAAQREIQWMAGKPQEFQALELQATNALVHGRVRQWLSLGRQAADLMRRRGLKLATELEVGTAVVQASFDNCGPLRALGFARAVPPADNLSVALRQAYWPPMCGEIAAAEKLADEAAKLRPLDTLLIGLELPRLRAAIELGRNQPEKALEFLKPAAQYARIYPGPTYLQGLAYLRTKKGLEAEAEFQKILDFKDIDTRGQGLVAWRPLAYVGLARAAVQAGELVKAKTAYQNLFALWKDADPDVPMLIEARKEYAALE